MSGNMFEPRLTGGESSHTSLTIGSAFKLNFHLVQPSVYNVLTQLNPSIWWVSKLFPLKCQDFEAVSAEYKEPFKFSRSEFCCSLEILRVRPLPTNKIQKGQIWQCAIPTYKKRVEVIYYRNNEVLIRDCDSMEETLLLSHELYEFYDPVTE